MRTYEINGNKFKMPKAFYRYAEDIFTNGFKSGRNLDAFSDLLEGGFGRHDCGELIIVQWRNMAKSREKLPKDFYQALIDIFEEAENVVFERYEYGDS